MPNQNMNALKHGAFSGQIILPGEAIEDLDELHQSVMKEWKPVAWRRFPGARKSKAQEEHKRMGGRGSPLTITRAPGADGICLLDIIRIHLRIDWGPHP
jgi:hypothetical protein